MFDPIASLYDATRPPPSPELIDALAGELKDAGVASILEVGVGTGRIAGPLADRGFLLTGLDVSRPMLARARGKGIGRLVRGTALRLPLGDRTVDAALFVHALHLVPDPPTALFEADRVARCGAMAVVHPRADAERTNPPGEEWIARRLFLEALALRGFSAPQDPGVPAAIEQRLLELLPPTRLTILDDRRVTEPAVDGLRPFEAGASRHTVGVPPEALREAAGEVRAALGDRTVSYRRRTALAVWHKGDRPARRRGSPAPTGRTGGP